jgi:hypothetical protein
MQPVGGPERSPKKADASEELPKNEGKMKFSRRGRTPCMKSERSERAWCP